LPDGRTLPVFVLTSSTASRRFLLTNPEVYSLTYNGLVMVAEKRRSDRWQALRRTRCRERPACKCLAERVLPTRR
jgi:hypothetical protein